MKAKTNKVKDIVGGRAHLKTEIQTEESFLLSTRQQDMSAALQEEY